MITFLAFFLIFLIVVGVHELGHALAALLFHVKIQRISLGFGKAVFSWQSKSGIVYSLGRWPLGGYVHLLNTRIDKVETQDLALCFDKQSLFRQAIILIAGSVMNAGLAMLALTFFYFLGFKTQPPIVKAVRPNSTMAQAGLVANDQILTINQEGVSSWVETGMSLAASLEQKKISLKVIHPGLGSRNIEFYPDKIQWATKGDFFEKLGIQMDLSKSTAQAGLPLHQAFLKAFEKFIALAVFFLTMIKLLILGYFPFSMLLGPLGFLSLTVKTFMQGLAVFLNFIATVSLSVGLVNLFPVPGLDGGSILYLLIEKIRGKPLSIAAELLCFRLAMIGFSILFIQLLLNDLFPS